LLLGLVWLVGGHLPERMMSRLTKLAYLALSIIAGMLAWHLYSEAVPSLRVSAGSWFSVADYSFPLTLVLDRLSLPLVAMTVVLAGLVGSFSVRYLHRDPGFQRFFLLLHLFAFGALVVFTAGSIDLLIAGWEIVGITSVLLIGFFQYRAEPVRNALRVFGMYRVADLCILVAAFLAHHWFHSASWDKLIGGEWPGQGSLHSGQEIAVLAVLLVFAACGKSAQGPFMGWLPRAMEGPTPSSAVFYGAISVHAGAYLLLRIEPLIRASTLATGLVICIGIATAVLSTMVHRTCADAKTSLAYATQTQLGIIFAEIGLGWTTMAVIHIIGHAMMRTMQFLRAPSMLHDYHRVHAAAGGHFNPTGEHYESLLPKSMQVLLYRIAMGRGFYDAILDRFIIAPVQGFARLLACLEPRWVKDSPSASPSSGQPLNGLEPSAGGQPHSGPSGCGLLSVAFVSLIAFGLLAPSLLHSLLVVTPFCVFVYSPVLLAVVVALRQRVPGASRKAIVMLLSPVALFLLLLSGESLESMATLWERTSCPAAFLFSLLTIVLALLAPKRDLSGSSLAGLLLVALGSLVAYLSDHNWLIFATGWWLSGLPFMLGMFGHSPARPVTSAFLLGSGLAMTAAAVMMSVDVALPVAKAPLVLGLMLAAVALRKGIFPLHSWVVTAFEHGPLLPMALLFNGHLGVLLMLSFEFADLNHKVPHILPWVGVAALVTALVASVRNFAEKKPRRMLAFLCISQASFILAGIATGTAQGITGGLLHWMVVAVASTGLIAIVRILEVRVMDVANPEGHLGLAVRAPRLATFFLICALALAGLPGTLGYCAEDLLFHGALESHPWLGMALLFATAFNAINLLRLYSLLFLGVLPKHVLDIPDALPRERWPLAALSVALILGGLWPATAIALRSRAAAEFEYNLKGRPGEASAPQVKGAARNQIAAGKL
jgi:NADH:ubiquinone oxidoreductase subunit 5 (subunit L)/multisubunit Na+/H+ antiporter MnhA subunit